LSKEPAERFPSAAAVASALRTHDSLQLDSTIAGASGEVRGAVAATTAAMRRAKSRAWLWWALAATLALGGVGAAVALRARNKSEPAPPKIEATPPKVEVTPPKIEPAPPKVEAPPPSKSEPPPVAAPPPKPAKHTHKPATKAPAKKSWNGEILEE
jgi:hypothetical protein